MPGEAPARALTGHRWGDGARRLDVLVQTDEAEALEGLPSALVWGYVWRTLPVTWAPYQLREAAPAEDGDRCQEEAAEPRSRIEPGLALGPSDSRGEPGPAGPGPEESEPVALALRGPALPGGEIRCPPPPRGGGFWVADVQEPPERVPTTSSRSTLGRLRAQNPDGSVVALVPGKGWDMNQLARACHRVSGVAEAGYGRPKTFGCAVLDATPKLWLESLERAHEARRDRPRAEGLSSIGTARGAEEEGSEDRPKLRDLEGQGGPRRARQGHGHGRAGQGEHPPGRASMHRREIQFCYERELRKDPDLKGKVKVKFTISGTGSVISAVISSSTLDDDRVEECLKRKIKRWVFPGPKGGGIVIVNYPFDFNSR